MIMDLLNIGMMQILILKQDLWIGTINIWQNILILRLWKKKNTAIEFGFVLRMAALLVLGMESLECLKFLICIFTHMQMILKNAVAVLLFLVYVLGLNILLLIYLLLDLDHTVVFQMIESDF